MTLRFMPSLPDRASAERAYCYQPSAGFILTDEPLQGGRHVDGEERFGDQLWGGGFAAWNPLDRTAEYVDRFLAGCHHGAVGDPLEPLAEQEASRLGFGQDNCYMGIQSIAPIFR